MKYSLTLDLYIDARNDHEAKVKAAQMIEEIREIGDEENNADALFLHKHTGYVNVQNIHTGKLRIIGNKLSEL